MSRTYPMTSTQVEYIEKKKAEQTETEKRPPWLKVKIPLGEGFADIKNLVSSGNLHTVCEEARCPNISECWNHGTATFMILGDVCTRSCGFCAVKTGKPTWTDEQEPRRVADSVRRMKLRHAVITSVNRDELPDGGARMFAETILAIRAEVPSCRIEVLIPDFKGNLESLKTVVDARPAILNHNIETVPRLYPVVRPQADYAQSLRVLHQAKTMGMITKTGIMLGLGETTGEVETAMHDLRGVDVDILTLGQYLRPTREHLPVDRYVHPDEFAVLKQKGLDMGFRFVESGPLVRSSYHAEKQSELFDRFLSTQTP